MGENIGKNMPKNLSVKCSQKRLDHSKQSARDALKTSKRIKSFKKQLKQLAISQKFQKIHNKLIQRHLQISMIKKYQMKDMYLQKRDTKLLMN